MRSLWDADARAEIAARVERLSPTSARLWGHMTIGEMLSHVGRVQRVPLGDLAPGRVPGICRFRPLAYALIHWIPWPKGRIQSPPGAVAAPSASFEEDRTAVLELIRRFAEKDPRGGWPPHPLFGPLTGRDWGVFSYRHLDHHLRQFGV
jgi:hypothetical protein